jgi:NAD-dependent deacetylase
MKKKIVVLTGAGISAESGLKTFRDSDGLWEGYNVQEVATPEGWKRDMDMVLEFYNQRRQAVHEAVPNEGHKALVKLAKAYDVSIITQNIDDLHERAGSGNVIHLHGEIFKSQSTIDPRLVYDMKGLKIRLGENCERGSQLRPFIVWFGEAVPMMETAIKITQEAEIFIIVGTSLAVYPAAGLLDYVGQEIPKYIVDPAVPSLYGIKNITAIRKKAGEGLPELVDELIKMAQ